MHIHGKIGAVRQVPFYLGHRPGDPFHLSVLCDEDGIVYTPERLAEAGISHRDVADLFEAKADTIAGLLRKTVNQISLRLTANEPPYIVAFADVD